MLVSVIIRTYNEEKYLNELLHKVFIQEIANAKLEVVIVDSGSTDNTLVIAERYGCRISHIQKQEFTYGRSLNVGCEFAKGDIFVFISGHCIPVNKQWLNKLIHPLLEQGISYTYGRQQGKDSTKFSEFCHFEKFFPNYSKQPQEGFFCNNANAALTKQAWEKFRFNEDLTGLEDMYLAKQLNKNNYKIAYVCAATVYHIHDETWQQVRIRYEREAFALQNIMPELHFNFSDFLRFYLSSVLSDIRKSIQEKVFFNKIIEIILFRFMQYWGTYRGNHEHRKLSMRRKMNYFYPKDLEKNNYD